MLNVELLSYYRGTDPITVYVMPDPKSTKIEKRQVPAIKSTRTLTCQ